MTLADRLSYSRIVLLAPIVAAALSGHRTVFMSLVAVGFATDAVDGYVARREGKATPEGASLDSLADALLYAAAWISSVAVFPVMWGDLRAVFLIVAVALIVPPIVGVLRYGRLPAFHTRLARVSTVAMGLGVLLLTLFDLRAPLQGATAILVVSVCEELAMLWLLAEWTPRVSSLLHAVRLSRGQFSSLPLAPLRRSQ